jgi:hypothetical protein
MPTSSTWMTGTSTTPSSSARMPSRSASGSSSRAGLGAACAAIGASTSASHPSAGDRASTCPTIFLSLRSRSSGYATGKAARRGASRCACACHPRPSRRSTVGRSTRSGPNSNSGAAATATKSAAVTSRSPGMRSKVNTCSFRPDLSPGDPEPDDRQRRARGHWAPPVTPRRGRSVQWPSTT